jgi:EAL domain-containing protein (putative c-di-GMP-specific phosphodiesterase class I)
VATSSCRSRNRADGFGVKHATFGYLHKLPLDRVTIDQVFVRDLPDDERPVAIVRALITLGRSLALDIVAEGIENEAQLAFLKEMNFPHSPDFSVKNPG